MSLLERYYIGMTFVLEVGRLDPQSLSDECHGRVEDPLPRTHVSLPNSDALPAHPENRMGLYALNNVIQSSLQLVIRFD